MKRFALIAFLLLAACSDPLEEFSNPIVGEQVFFSIDHPYVLIEGTACIEIGKETEHSFAVLEYIGLNPLAEWWEGDYDRLAPCYSLDIEPPFEYIEVTSTSPKD